MTQIASFDLGAAAAAKRQQTPNLGASKGHGDFMAAFRQAAAEARKQDRAEDADRAAEARAERDRDTGCADEAQEAFEAKDSSHTERAEKPKSVDQPQDKPQAKVADQANDAAAKPQAPAEKPVEPTQDAAPVAETPVEAPVAETPAEPQPALDAQAVLALQLATGGQVAQPVMSQLHAQGMLADQAATEAVDHALTVTANGGQTPASAQAAAQTQATTEVDQATQKAMAEALRQAQAQAQAEPAKAQAQANGLATAQATAHAQANAQAQSPAFLAQAARDLGGITMQVSTAKPETPVTTPVAEGQVETTNLSIVLNELETQPLAKGPIAPVTMLDGADGTEMPSQLPSLTTEDEAAEAVLATETDSTPVAPLLNGDRGVGDVAKAESAKAPALPVRPEDVLPQVSKHLDQLKANQANAIKLQLYPEHLGKMEIKVVSHQGVISAQLTADSHAVKGMLESQVAQLQRTFAEMGLKVDKVEVTIASSQMNFDAQDQATQQGDAQQFGRQSQNQGAFQGSGYQQWLGDEPIDDAHYAQLDQAAVDYVA